MTLSRSAKIIAIVASALSILGAVGAWADARASAAVAPQKARVDNIEKRESDLENTVKSTREDLSYIRGRIDDKWGKK